MQKVYYKKQKFLSRNNFKTLKALGRAPSFLFLACISVYQYTLSPDHGIVGLYTIGRCKFRPTCSEYVKNTIQQYGVIMGIRKGLKQIKKCL